MNVENKEDLKTKTENILSGFAVVKRKSSGHRETTIAQSPLSQQKIEEFKNEIGKTWESQARIHQIIKSHGSFVDVTNEEVKLLHIGQRTFFEKAKMLFIEGEFYSPIYGIGRIGGEIGRWEDDSFFSTVLNNEDIRRIESADVTELLDKAIRILREDGITPTLILMPTEYNYKDEKLLKSKKFSSVFVQGDQNDLGDFALGKYDDIPVYSSFSSLLDNRVLVCDFKEAIQMRFKSNDDWYNRELTVNVHEVTDEDAKQRLDRQPEKWRVTEDGIYLSDEEALTLIKTSVVIDIWVTEDFQVLKGERCVIGQLQNANHTT